jgi:hypothetical protein
LPLKLSVWSGINEMVTNPVRPIRTDRFGNPTDRLAESPTESRSLSKQTLDFEDLSVTRHADTEFNGRYHLVTGELCSFWPAASYDTS